MKRRQTVASGLTGALAVSGVLGFLPTPAFAEAPHLFRVDVVNSAESNIKVRFFYSGTEGQGGAAMFDKDHKEEFPNGHTTSVEAGHISKPFTLQTPPDFHDSGYWVEAYRDDDGQDRTVAKFYRHAPKDDKKNANPITLNDQKGTSLRISAEGGDFPGRTGRMRIFITEPAAHTDSAENSVVSLKHLVAGNESEPPLVADAKDWSKEPGSPVVGWEPNGGNNQKWAIGPHEDDWFSLANLHSGMCLDVKGMHTEVGTPLQQWECNGGSNQLFKIVNGQLIEKHSQRPVILEEESQGARLVIGDRQDNDRWEISDAAVDFSVDFGKENGGWQSLAKATGDEKDPGQRNDDQSTEMSTLNGLLPDTDYWFRCYDSGFKDVRVNGRKPPSEALGTDGSGFWRTSDSKGRIIALRSTGSGPHDGVCDIRVASAKGDAVARQITQGNVEGDPDGHGDDMAAVYKVSIPSRDRVYDAVDSANPGVDRAVPDAIRIPPYLVEGRDASGKWVKVGTVLPASAPMVDAAAGKVTYGGATFYFQNKRDQHITDLRISGGYTGLGSDSQVIHLKDLAKPTLSSKDISDFHVAVTSNPINNQNGIVTLDANGAVQEKLTVTATAKGDHHQIDPSEANLGSVYDDIYYTDEYGRLVTGMYDPDGSWAVTPEAGATENQALGVAGTAGDDPTHAYLSTTDRSGGQTNITPTFMGGDGVTHGPLQIRPVTRPYVFSGASLDAGLNIKTLGETTVFPANPAETRGSETLAPVYRLKASGTGASDRPFSVALTRYRAITAARDLPRSDMQQCAPDAVTVEVKTDKLKVAKEDSSKNAKCAETELTLNVISKTGAQLSGNVPSGR